MLYSMLGYLFASLRKGGHRAELNQPNTRQKIEGFPPQELPS